MIDKRKKGMVPGLILRPSHIMMMQLPPILRALWGCERKSNLYLLYDKNWNLRVLCWRYFWFKFPTSPSQVSNSALLGVPFLSNSLLPEYTPLSNTRRFRGGEGGGMLMFRVVRCILQTLNTVKGFHNYHKFYQHPPTYYTKERVYSEHLNLPIRQLEREKDLNYFMSCLEKFPKLWSV